MSAIVFGECHGNSETPRLVGTVATALALRGAMRLALEIDHCEQASIDGFVASGERTRLLAGPFWSGPQDGRKSVAMVELVDCVGALRRAGRDAQVIAIDDESTDDRDAAMAARLGAAMAREPAATFIVLVGNAHARKRPHPDFPTQQPMAQLLVAAGHDVTCLDARYGRGTSWCISDDADGVMLTPGSRPLGRDEPLPHGIVLGRTDDGAYDGTFTIESPTASPPAVAM
jgi:erythromycin esterase-like protein